MCHRKIDDTVQRQQKREMVQCLCRLPCKIETRAPLTCRAEPPTCSRERERQGHRRDQKRRELREPAASRESDFEGIIMTPSRTVISLLLSWVTVTTQRHSGGGGGTLVDAAVLQSYPTYCAKDMDVNAIPPLEDSVKQSFGGDVSLGNVELLQVHAMIRHGARGPYTQPRCWEGYDMQWDCNVTEVVSPSLSVDDGGVTATGLFRKRYDAFPSDNALGGTCMAGQLLDEGYEQEQANGRRHLKAAYLCSEPSCLLAEDATAKDLQDSGALYLRSDDEQRTVMSGQILTASMLDVSGAVVDWHTGDDEYDYMEPNTATCPRLSELSEEALTDPVWLYYAGSAEVQLMNNSLTSVWEEEVIWWDVLDCLMTTACTGRALPEDLTEDVFEEATTYSARHYAQESVFNDAAYGKLAMAKFTLEIRERMLGAMNGTSPLKFILLSGHDTTFIPFMAAVAPSVWDRQWPPYATLSTIELLRVGGGAGAGGDGDGDGDAGGGYFFRFVYNGQVLKLEGCDHEICAIDAFLDVTQFSVDLEDSSHCCCKNMTQAAVDEYENNKNNSSTSNSSSSDAVPVAASSPAPALVSAPTPSPSIGDVGGIVTTGTAAVASSDSTSSSGGNGPGVAGAGAAAAADTGGGAGGAVGIAFACFVIGAIVGGVPALMYFRSFRYEQMRGGGHSYEMA
ncbi:unnamed protein product [Pylaiella littoralis]